MHKAWHQEDEEDNGFAQFGGYMDAKKSKLMRQIREKATDNEQKSAIFKGIAIFVNGHTKPSSEELKILLAEHGGTFHIYQMPSTTHIIASNLPNVKINKLGPLPIVKPTWIADSITLGRLLDYSTYLLYTNQNRLQPQLNFASTSSKTASDPSFLSEFYGNSRLHLISTLGAEFKQLVNDLRKDKTRECIGLQRLKEEAASQLDEFASNSPPNEEIIMHIDMDCFFVSVGIRNRPELRGKPVAVTHSKTGQGRANVDRSVEIAMYRDRLPEGADFRLADIDDNSSLSEIASCSYEARKTGVKNGMFMGQALKLCPELRAIPYDFEGYKEVSKTLYTTIAEYTLNIEAVSCDEMYVNITSVLTTSNCSVSAFAAHIRDTIKNRTGCPCSTGFGGNRLQARLATKRAKPDGSYHLTQDLVESYFHSMPLAELPGVGRATLAKMKALGLDVCGDVQGFDLATLRKELGAKVGETIAEQARGVDRKPLQYEHERKSVSAEVNYGIRFQAQAECDQFVERLAGEVVSRLAETGMKAKCITLKLMVRAEDAPTEAAKYLGHGVCDNISRSFSLQHATDDEQIICRETKLLLGKLAVPFAELRGLGIQLSKLEKTPQVNAVLKSFLASASKPQAKTPSSPPVTREKVASPVKKSGRGRKANIAAPGTSKGLKDFFKATQKPFRADVKIKKAEIDLAVLQELPQDIRDEIIKEYSLAPPSPTVVAPPKPICVPETCGSAKPVDQKEKGGFDSLSHEDFLSMLANWLQSHEEPLAVDIEMLAEYLEQLAQSRKIERLYVYMKFLHRNIEPKVCLWHQAYFTMVESLQKGMVSIYRCPLLIPMGFSSSLGTFCSSNKFCNSY